MKPINDNNYCTGFPTCTGCGLMFTAASLEKGVCPPCRQEVRCHVQSLLFWLFVVASIVLILLYTGDSNAGMKDSTAWLRCYEHGDWKETPYCTAAAREMEG